jgi:hypothetical protein
MPADGPSADAARSPAAASDLRAQAADLFSRADAATTRRERARLMLQAVRLLGRAEGQDDEAKRLRRKRAAAARPAAPRTAR